jgi:uncharacterized protein YjbI with pentapeptide repeats
VPPEYIKSIVAYIALAVPITVAVANIARIAMEWLKQRHAIRSAQVQQSHQITAHYLDRTLDPSVPLAFRHQLLRFLATPDRGGSRLSDWAANELKRVGGIVDETNRAVATAEAEIQEAKTAADIANAERRLAGAVKKQRSLLEPAATPPVTAAALRAGLVEEKNLNGISMSDADLSGADIVYKELRGADFTRANLSSVRLQGCDLRAATFVGANLKETIFLAADLRGADMSDAVIRNTDFTQAWLEGANMHAKGLETANLKATFDASTRWPADFDPIKAGAVLVG